MNRKTFLNSVIGAFALGVTGFAASAQSGDPIKVGEINHYKRLAAFAEPYKQGIELALEEINADGGVLDRPLEFIFRDDQGDPGEAIKIAETSELVHNALGSRVFDSFLRNKRIEWQDYDRTVTDYEVQRYLREL